MDPRKRTLILLGFLGLLMVLAIGELSDRDSLEKDQLLERLEERIKGGDLAGALVLLESDPTHRKDPMLFMVTLDLLFNLRQHEKYFQTIEGTPELAGREDVKNHLLGAIRKFITDGKLPASSFWLERGADLLPVEARFELRGEILFQTGRFREALDVYRAWEHHLSGKRDNLIQAFIQYRLARSMFGMVLPTEEVRAPAKRAVELAPENPEYVRFHANCLPMKEGRTLLENFIASDSARLDSIASVQLYSLYLRLNEVDKARDLVSAVLTKNPDFEFFAMANLTLTTQVKRFRQGQVSGVIRIPPLASPSTPLYFFPNWGADGRVGDTVSTAPIPCGSNEFTIPFNLSLLEEDEFHFTLATDPKGAQPIYFQEVFPHSLTASGGTLLPRITDYRPAIPPLPLWRPLAQTHVTPTNPGRLVVLILDGVSWNLVRGLGAQGYLPVFTGLFQSGFAAQLFCPLPQTNIALEILSTHRRAPFLLSDLMTTWVRELRVISDRFWPLDEETTEEWESWQNGNRREKLSDALFRMGFRGLDLIYHSYPFPPVDFSAVGVGTAPSSTGLELSTSPAFKKLCHEMEFRFKTLRDHLQSDKMGDFVFFYLMESDTACHNLWAAYKLSLPPFNRAFNSSFHLPLFFQRLDRHIGEVAATLTSSDTLLILSDHGTLNASEHSKRGVFLAYGPGLAPTQERLFVDQRQFRDIVLDFFTAGGRKLRPARFARLTEEPEGPVKDSEQNGSTHPEGREAQ